jgi:hypothetical protein
MYPSIFLNHAPRPHLRGIRIVYVVEGRPHIGVQGWDRIYALFQKFDEVHKEDAFPGGIWLNLGFLKDETLGAWEVDTSEMKFMFKA